MKLAFPALDRCLGLLHKVDGSLGVELREAFLELSSQLTETKDQVGRLTEAQADALVNSAMLMTELQAARIELESVNEATKAMNCSLEKALSEVRSSEERFRLLSDTAPVGIFQITADDRCVYTNDYLRQVFQMTTRNAGEFDWRHWLQPDGQAVILAKWDSMLADRREFSGELRIRTTNGVDRWVSVVAQPFSSGEEQFAGYIGTMSDITEQKELDQLKDDLVATVSHELRTPLASLRGFIELLLHREFSSEKRRQFLTIMHEESMRLTRLINDFLDLQRMASGRQPYSFATIDVAQFVRDRVALFSEEETTHPLCLALTEPLPRMSVDEDRLHQVLVNLVSNARKFSPPHSPVTIRVWQQGEEVIFSVKDCGVGIPAEALSQLFRKFFRVDNRATRNIGGTGLGLALVKEIVEAHHGRVWVESEVGVGSTFFFALPIASVEISPTDCDGSPSQGAGSLTC